MEEVRAEGEVVTQSGSGFTECLAHTCKEVLQRDSSLCPVGGGSREQQVPYVCHLDLLGSETLLADIALDLLRLIMVDHWSWLCTENMQKVLHLLFGTLIERYGPFVGDCQRRVGT